MESTDLRLFERDLSYRIGVVNIKTIANADILRDSIFEKWKLRFHTIDTHVLGLTFLQRLLRLRLLLRPAKTVDKALWITDDWSPGFFHWFMDALPRLMASLSSIEGHAVVLPEWYKKESYIPESLALLKVQTIFYDDTRRLRVKELLLPGHVANTGNYNKEFVNVLRDKFISSNTVAPNRKIYVSREKAPRRKITNESEVTDLMRSQGFEIHHFESYGLAKQIELMSQSACLAGLHGAGLTNMLFMPKGGHVLEIRNMNDAHNNCYFSLASELGHDYYYVLSQGNTSDTQNANVRVDIEKLRKAVTQMLSA